MLPVNLPELIEARNILRLPVALPDAGAFDADNIVFVSDHRFFNLYFGYLRGAALGAFSIIVEFSPFSDDIDAVAVAAGVQIWYQDIAFAVGGVAAGVETTSLIQQERMSYTAEGATQENFMLQVIVNKGMERIRISVAETGVVGTPGDCQIISYLG